MTRLALLAAMLVGCWEFKAFPVVDTAGPIVDDLDLDGDGWTAPEDCDDTPPTETSPGGSAIFPGAPEWCNGADDDCDGETDEYTAADAASWFLDLDGDGAGDAADTPIPSCGAVAGRVANDDDCDDADPSIRPGAEEVCDGIDNDCDGVADPGLTSPWYQDADADGYGNPAVVLEACLAPTGYVANDDDCDDADSHAFPGASWYPDGDGDLFGTDTGAVVSCLPPPSYAWAAGDCDDTDPAVNPDASERCDGLDNDCDTSVDEGDAIDAATWYEDGDADGYGDPTAPRASCDLLPGFVSDATDCDDSRADVHPGAVERCFDGMDDDCDGTDDEACPVYVCGTITADTTWSDPFGYYVGCTTRVEGAASPILTIEAGNTVYFAEGTSLIVGDAGAGGLAVEGSGSAPVVFTSGVTIVDPTAGPAVGDWGGLQLGERTLADSHLDALEVAWFGAGGAAGIVLDGAAAGISILDGWIHDGENQGIEVLGGAFPSITGTTVEAVDGVGIYASDTSGFLAFENNTLTANTSFPLEIAFSEVVSLDDTSAYAGNLEDYVALRGETLTVDLSLVALEIPYLVTSDLSVAGSSTPRLTVEDGVEVFFNYGVDLTVGSGSRGSLVVDGAATGVRFSAYDPARGWNGITVYNNATDVELEGLVLEGGGGNGRANLYIYSSVSPVLRGCVLTGSSTSGLEAGASSFPDIEDSIFSDNAEYGIYLDDDAGLATTGTPTFSGNVLSGNGEYPLALSANFLGQIASDNTFSGNGDDHVLVWADTVGTSATWRSLDVSYLVAASSAGAELLIQGSSSPVVTVEAGATFEMDPGTSIMVGETYPGGLKTQGTAAAPVSFVSSGGCSSPGEWDGITLYDDTSGSSTELAGIVIDCAGGDGNGALYVYDRSSGPSISMTDCDISNSSSYGVRFYALGGLLAVRGCTISENGSYGIYLQDGSLSAFSDNVLTGNQTPLYLPVEDLGDLDDSSVFTGNVYDQVEVEGGDVNTTTTWANVGVPFVFKGNITVQNSATVTLAEGLETRWAGGYRLQIGSNSTSKGGLVVRGTSSNPVVMTADASSPYAGYWGGIYMKSTYCTSDVTIEGLEMSYGGTSSSAAINFSACSGSVKDSSLSYSSGYCVSCGSGTITLSGVTYASCAAGNTYGC